MRGHMHTCEGTAEERKRYSEKRRAQLQDQDQDKTASRGLQAASTQPKPVPW